jgi:hypothetical protein
MDFGLESYSLIGGILVLHITEFYTLWSMLQEVQIIEETIDTISRKLTSDERYCAASTYLPQLETSPTCIMKPAVWGTIGSPPKCKFFAWLILQNRSWLVDRLTR